MKNYSKRREVIMEVLSSTTTHPTVNWIYERARQKIPNISLGTVYRNLTDLAKEGIISEVPVGDGYQHFDANTSNHIHFYCLSCGKIVDCEPQDDSLKDYVEKTLDCKVSAEKRLFQGECHACRGLNKN
ncbi:MAG: transcriptional repressor [Ruminococcaceae bacterium]|nr:transcriptional repressor [Oscillospiraceae bacterium]